MRILNNRFAIVLLLLVATLVGAQTEEKQKLTVEAALQLKMVRSVDVSPDGSEVIYSVRVPASLEGSEKTASTIYYLHNGAAMIQLTEPGDGIGSLAWTLDGAAITYLKDGQLYKMQRNLQGIWHQQISNLDVSISSNYKVSPSGAAVAWVATRPWTEAEEKAREMGKDFDVVEEDYRHRQVNIYNFDTEIHRVATPDEYSVWAFDWSPDGRELVITATEEKTTDASYMLKKIYRLDIASGERELLVDTEGKLTAPHWSPDGSMIAWAGGIDKTDPYQGSLFVYTLETGELENLTGDYIGTVKDLAWAKDGNLHVRYAEFEEENLYQVDPETGSMTLVAGKDIIVGGFDSGGTTLALTASTPTHPSELYVSWSGKELKRATKSNPELENYALGKQVVFKWTASDGLPLQGILIYPVDYQEGTRYPLIVQPHGGPESNYANGWNTYYSRWSQMLANEGYFVFAPNYRASTGRGVEFAKADHNDLGGAEFQDVVDGVKALVEQGLVDADRVGSGGGSYGGYFSALAATKGSEHFAAAVVFAGITNWISFQGTSDIPIENAWVHWNESEWYLKQDLMMQGSPVHYIDRANTPTLIAHGEKDLRVPLGQGQELFRMLKLKGVPTQFVVYPRAGHGLAEIQHQYDYATRVIGWFNKYVRDTESN